jgi:hypothetical protein
MNGVPTGLSFILKIGCLLFYSTAWVTTGCHRAQKTVLLTDKSKAVTDTNVGAANAPRSTERGFNLSDSFANIHDLKKSKVRLGYTGVDFIGKCGPSGRIFLPDLFTMGKVLEPFANGRDLLGTYLASLEEADASKVRAPGSPAHPAIRQRLGEGIRPDAWQLNLIRFRTNHIKLNYELPLIDSKVDGTIEFAALIHSFKIPETLVNQYQSDLARLDQTQESLACSLDTFLRKWLTVSEYFFVHSNIFDLSSSVKEWRFTEGKLVTPSNVILSGNSATSSRLTSAAYELRIVQMEFPFKQLGSDGLLENSKDGTSYRTFWSGESTDVMVDLLSPIAHGGLVALNHPAFEHDAAMTCAQCHARNTGPVAVDVAPPFSRQMAPVKSMHFRHVGFGVEPPHGILRLYNEAQFSPYFEQLLLKESGQ